MSRGYLIAILLAVAAIVFSSPQAIQQLWPDLGRSEVLAINIGCAAITVALVVASIVAAMWGDDPAAKWRRRASGFKGKVIRRSILPIAIVLGLAWYLRDFSDPLRNQLPGFTAYAVLSLQNQPDFHRKYVYVFGPEDASHAEFYLSASGEYTFVITNLYGDKYPLETNIGDDGVPLNKFIALFSQVAITDKTTILRLSVNDKEIIRRTMPFVIKIPKETNWQPARIGGGSFLLFEIGALPFSISNGSLHKLWMLDKKSLGL